MRRHAAYDLARGGLDIRAQESCQFLELLYEQFIAFDNGTAAHDDTAGVAACQRQQAEGTAPYGDVGGAVDGSVLAGACVTWSAPLATAIHSAPGR